MKMPTILRAIMFGLLAISFVASGQSASLAFGACWIVGATLAVVKGIQAIRTEALSVIPNELGFQQEAISQIKEPMRFWFFVSLLFILAVIAAAYGVYVVSGVLSNQ